MPIDNIEIFEEESQTGMPGGLSGLSDLGLADDFDEDQDLIDLGFADDTLDLTFEPEEEEVELELKSDPNSNDIVFLLDPVPGAPNAEDILEEGEIEVIDTGDEDIEIDDNPWNWMSKGPGGFINWLSGMIGNIPQHSGHDTTGLEKAISYFENIDKEISKAMRQDYKNEIDSAKAEKAREEIENGLERLVERLEKVKTTKYKRHKKKKKAWYEPEMVKEASGSAKIVGITITVPLMISHCARVAINGTVSAGHDIEDMFIRLSSMYDLGKQQKVEFRQLLADMGYPMHLDRGYEVGEPVDTTQSDNFDFMANYSG